MGILRLFTSLSTHVFLVFFRPLNMGPELQAKFGNGFKVMERALDFVMKKELKGGFMFVVAAAFLPHGLGN